MVKVRVCTGMHCSMDGGGNPLGRAIQEALTKAGVMDRVEMWSAHCLGECENGPCVRVNTERFYHIHLEDVPRLVQEEILPAIERDAENE